MYEKRLCLLREEEKGRESEYISLPCVEIFTSGLVGFLLHQSETLQMKNTLEIASPCKGGIGVAESVGVYDSTPLQT